MVDRLNNLIDNVNQQSGSSKLLTSNVGEKNSVRSRISIFLGRAWAFISRNDPEVSVEKNQVAENIIRIFDETFSRVHIDLAQLKVDPKKFKKFTENIEILKRDFKKGRDFKYEGAFNRIIQKAERVARMPSLKKEHTTRVQEELKFLRKKFKV